MKEKKICNKCFGKGYRTELKGIRDLRNIRDGKTISDFSGDAIGSFTAMIFCDCDGGKELEIRVKEYADWKMKELHKQRILKKFGSEDAKRQYFMQKQRECRARKKLSNKDKIK